MRLAWATDIHLNFARPRERQAFEQQLGAQQADALVITGDIAEAPDFDLYLNRLAARFAKPIYYVLGNHDFYRSTIAETRQRARLTQAHWLPDKGIVELSATTALIGHDGWADARFGRYYQSDVLLNDFFLIGEFKGLSRSERKSRMEEFAAETAEYFRETLPAALERYEQVIVATHVPPFGEATWHEGRISDDDWLPFFSSKAAGDALLDAARRYAKRKIVVLCGHTHGAGFAQIADNLAVHTGGAVYGYPAMQEPFDLD
jgi:predicted phosphodiesterase